MRLSTFLMEFEKETGHSKLHKDTRLKRDLGIDSFQRILLVMHFEDLLGVSLPDNSVHVRTVGQFFKFINGE